ncbi:hypothetical protein EDEG_00005 [Edhazardia aedis USNM 41457]|uniref:Uncharacterized protein n=1 Tax=Edhazardia aedis (strain USNM 41457) TaxID=1003232 RepID=J9DCC9_EDHAE|nr:hypothetical protein EDEG_00005 [Edhazardia aedis USNM 41457]|eukprot:EJW05396.1 hypothetical protein EDEG_00005 [Edhazardia aedis USNM 41457]
MIKQQIYLSVLYFYYSKIFSYAANFPLKRVNICGKKLEIRPFQERQTMNAVVIVTHVIPKDNWSHRRNNADEKKQPVDTLSKNSMDKHYAQPICQNNLYLACGKSSAENSISYLNSNFPGEFAKIKNFRFNTIYL